MRGFYNPNQLPLKIILLRISDIDVDVKAETYTAEIDDATVYGAHIESTATDTQIESLLGTPLTITEQNYLSDFTVDRQQIKNQYQSTIDRLIQIENATSPTNAQVIQAVRDLAKFVRLLLKLLTKTLW